MRQGESPQTVVGMLRRGLSPLYDAPVLYTVLIVLAIIALVLFILGRR
jgi:hypothetical protein